MFDTPPASAITATDTVTVLDPDATPNHVLERDKPFTIQVDFQLNGPNVQFLGGQWTVTAYATGLSLPASVNLGSATTPLVPTDGHAYSVPIIVAANALAEGVYQMVVVITNQNGGQDTQMAGFNQGTVIDIREP
ncbi:hypothetical protein [Actinomycetospora sp. TBRC 11914]|uniref:hypothetical protein n=1 Tax=Actinomycetospora sp. TBRC 11914 TaxID=2729387 RepID=UPI00145F5996|nr:hypothetical protein [Actinomycetospora sp. TBRC 11914]NMO90316.1 hypothetical protein [Actinomycetospora sp. TBRC 11914]